MNYPKRNRDEPHVYTFDPSGHSGLIVAEVVLGTVAVVILGAILSAAYFMWMPLTGPYCPGEVPSDWLGYCHQYPAQPLGGATAPLP